MAPKPSFDAVRPEAADTWLETQARPGASTVRPSSEGPELDGAVRCPRCGRPVPADRRFCRCGQLVARVTPEDEEDEERAQEPWYARLRGGVRRGRAFWRRVREANGGVRAHYDRALFAQAYLARATAVLAGLGIAATFALPGAAEARRQVLDQFSSLDPRGFAPVRVGATATDPETTPASWFDVAHATDGTTGRAWATIWEPPVDAGEQCRREGGAPALVLTLERPSSIDRIVLVPGLPPSSPDRDTVFRPALVDVVWGDGEDDCAPLVLQDGEGSQAFDVDADDVEMLRLVIVDAHAPLDEPEGDKLVVLSEVQLLERTSLW